MALVVVADFDLATESGPVPCGMGPVFAGRSVGSADM